MVHRKSTEKHYASDAAAAPTVNKKKAPWLRRPMQLLTQGQWWSNFITQLRVTVPRSHHQSQKRQCCVRGGRFRQHCRHTAQLRTCPSNKMERGMPV